MSVDTKTTVWLVIFEGGYEVTCFEKREILYSPLEISTRMGAVKS